MYNSFIKAPTSYFFLSEERISYSEVVAQAAVLLLSDWWSSSKKLVCLFPCSFKSYSDRPEGPAEEESRKKDSHPYFYVASMQNT